MTPRVVTPVATRVRGFKSSPLPDEMDGMDGMKNSGRSNVTREGDGSAFPSETVMRGNRCGLFLISQLGLIPGLKPLALSLYSSMRPNALVCWRWKCCQKWEL